MKECPRGVSDETWLNLEG